VTLPLLDDNSESTKNLEIFIIVMFFFFENFFHIDTCPTDDNSAATVYDQTGWRCIRIWAYFRSSSTDRCIAAISYIIDHSYTRHIRGAAVTFIQNYVFAWIHLQVMPMSPEGQRWWRRFIVRLCTSSRIGQCLWSHAHSMQIPYTWNYLYSLEAVM